MATLNLFAGNHSGLTTKAGTDVQTPTQMAVSKTQKELRNFTCHLL